MGHYRNRPARALLLTLQASGGAILTPLRSPGMVLWSSATDKEFLEEFASSVVDENDVAELTEYLVDEGHLSAVEAERLEVDIEVLSASAAHPVVAPEA